MEVVINAELYIWSQIITKFVDCFQLGFNIRGGQEHHCGIYVSKVRVIESTTTLYKDREIHPSAKDLQSTTRLAESWMLHIFDTRVDFPVPVQSGGWLFFSYPLLKLIAEWSPLFCFRNYHRTFSDHKTAPTRRRVIVNVMTSLYDHHFRFVHNG